MVANSKSLPIPLLMAASVLVLTGIAIIDATNPTGGHCCIGCITARMEVEIITENT